MAGKEIVMQIKFGVEARRVIQFLVNSPRGVRAAAMRAIATYIIGDGRHGLKHYPRYQHITRRRAFGKPFQSEKQRRYVMARIREGIIDPGYPHRTGRYQRSIVMKDSDDWRRITITGQMPHAGWPNRLARLIGWRDWSEIVKSNLDGALRAGKAAVNAWLSRRR